MSMILTVHQYKKYETDEKPELSQYRRSFVEYMESQPGMIWRTHRTRLILGSSCKTGIHAYSTKFGIVASSSKCGLQACSSKATVAVATAFPFNIPKIVVSPAEEDELTQMDNEGDIQEVPVTPRHEPLEPTRAAEVEPTKDDNDNDKVEPKSSKHEKTEKIVSPADKVASMVGLICPNEFPYNDINGYYDVKRTLEAEILGKYGLNRCFRLFPNETTTRHVLLYGHQEKTMRLIAQHVAKQANINFITTSGSQFKARNRTHTSDLLRELFLFAVGKQPCILFLDDIDLLCGLKVRSSALDPKLRFCQELDFSKRCNHSIFVVAATEKPWLLNSGFQTRCHKMIFVADPYNTKRNKKMVRFRAQHDPNFVRIEEDTFCSYLVRCCFPKTCF